MDIKGGAGAYQALPSQTNNMEMLPLPKAKHVAHEAAYEMRDETSTTAFTSQPQTVHTESRSDSLLRRIGHYTVVVNVLGLVGLCVAVSVISWLWFGGRQHGSWMAFILRDMITQTVTLCSVLIRITSAVQGASIVSLVAAIVLESPEKGGIRLVDTPAMSIARYSNSGPVPVLYMFWRSISLRHNWPFFYVLLAAIAVIASQLTSTLLLWDIDLEPILDLPLQVETGVGFGYDVWYNNNLTTLAYQGRNYWTAPVLTAPAFAEWSEPAGHAADSISDTGPSLRSFLPIGSAQARSQVLSFEGNAAVFDTRVVCARPRLQFDWIDLAQSSGVPNGYINGTLRHGDFPADVKPLLKFPDNQTNQFNISLRDVPPGTFLLHEFRPTLMGLSNTLGTIPNVYSNTTDVGHAFLVIYYHSPSGQVLPEGVNLVPAGSFDLNPSQHIDAVVGEDGVWAHFHNGIDRKKMTHQMTVCYDAHFAPTSPTMRYKQHQNFEVKASRQVAENEPTIKWDTHQLNYDSSSFSAGFMQSSNAPNPTRFVLERDQIDDRLQHLRKSWASGFIGLMNEKNFAGETLFSEFWIPIVDASEGHNKTVVSMLKDNERTMLMQREMYDFIHAVMWAPFRDTQGTFSIRAICKTCETLDKRNVGAPKDVTTLNPALSSIFFDVFNATGGDPAKAWQALTTAVISSAYYDFLPTFATNETVTITQFVMRNQPVRYRGYAIAISIAFVHVLLLVIILRVFQLNTSFSLISSSWQSVSQLIAPETMPVLERATMARDGEVSLLQDNQHLMRNDGPAVGTYYNPASGETRVVLRRYEGGTVGVAAC